MLWNLKETVRRKVLGKCSDFKKFSVLAPDYYFPKNGVFTFTIDA